MGRFRGRPSKRDQVERINAAHRFYGAMSDKPGAAQIAEQLVTQLAPKRERVRRPVARVLASEHMEQAAVISWWALVYQQYHLPEFALFAVPNGGARDVVTGSRLKSEGVRRGVPDLMLAHANGEHAGLFLELKVGNNKPSQEQIVFMEYLASAGYTASVHWDSGSAIKAIQEYLGKTPFDKAPT